ncbi:MAG: C-GCAxxG-C-C family protein [Chloroflexota bacterium]|nr:MAG: C-GCAxxG-C-C family protein [Chloroflexota bacterium]
MWEAYGLGNEDLLWSGVAFTGGIGGQQQAPCGAVSSSAICLGLRYRSSDKQKAKQARLDARQDASDLVKNFIDKFGSISCFELVGIDFSQPGGYQQFRESGVWQEKCDNYVQFVIEKLYELDAKRATAAMPEQVVIYTKPGCPYCAEAKRDLEERAVPYKEISVEGNPKAIEELMHLSNGKGIVPTLVIGEEVKVGFGGG